MNSIPRFALRAFSRALRGRQLILVSPVRRYFFFIVKSRPPKVPVSVPASRAFMEILESMHPARTFERFT